MRHTIVILSGLLLAAVCAQADTMVHWGAPGGEDVISANQGCGGTTTYDPNTPISPAEGANGYYITDSANRTPTIYGADNCTFELRNGAADWAWLAKYIGAEGDVIKAKLVWQDQDFLTDRTATVTNFSLNIGGEANTLAYTNRWLVERSGQFYISQETFGVFNGDVDASTLSWYEYTPMSGGSDTIGAPATISLRGLDSVGFYMQATCTNGTGWRRPFFNYFAVQGDMGPATTNTITATSLGNGSITPSGVIEVLNGGSTNFAITAAARYHVEDVLINGVSIGATNVYTFEDVTSNQTIHATFARTPVTMVQWGAPGGDNIISANQGCGGTATYDPGTAINPAYGANGYYIDSANRTPTIYGADNCTFELWNGATDVASLSKYINAEGEVIKAMLVWQDQDFMNKPNGTVTSFSLNIYGDADKLAYTNRWLVEKSGQFYVSQETFGVFNGDVDASALSWYKYTPMVGGSDTIGAATPISLHGLDSVGFYVHATCTNGTSWRRPAFNYFAVQGIPDPIGTVITIR